MWLRLGWLVGVLAWSASALAQAEGGAAVSPIIPSGTVSFALVVGHNEGGAAQQILQFAEDDATRFAQALVELGRFPPGRVRLLQRPTRSEVLAGLASLEGELSAAAAAGTETRVVFYFSGHARANALNLGAELLELADLRERLVGLSAKLKVIVLDACQSGAFSRPKGAQRAADFSYNSVERLRTEGVVVMASSSSNELSQESEELGASYFTHHLLVAMRGAGDANQDGLVTLAEAYEYSYHRTLAATAATAIGGQHVTLETELRGQGDVTLSFPARADAVLVLPEGLSGELVVTQVPSRTVIAEVHKVAGVPMQLALPSGRYSVLMAGAGGGHRRCEQLVNADVPTPLSVEDCEALPEPSARAKGGESDLRREQWAIELGLGLGTHRNGEFVGTLEKFGYSENGNIPGRLQLGGWWHVLPYLAVGGQFSSLDGRRFVRRTLEFDQDFQWRSYAAGPSIRLASFSGWFVPYADFGVGMSLATTSLEEAVVVDPSFVPALGSDEQPSLKPVERSAWDVGAYLSLAAGVQLMPWDKFGFFAQLGWSYAPTISNRFDETHDVGGFSLLVGARLRGVGAR